MSEAVLEWFRSKGINEETINRFGIKSVDDGGVSFDYGNGIIKTRYGIPHGERRFSWKRGVSPCLYNQRDLPAKTVFVCEGETDTLRLWQELGNTPDVAVVGLPGINTWNSGMADALAESSNIFVCLDNDADYNVAKRVDESYREIHRSLGNRTRRILLPRGINDLCDFFQDHSLDAFRLLVDRQPKPGESRFRTLDLTKEPPTPEWVVNDLICKGDIHLIIGEPDVGKSWITMALSVAVAKGLPTFLGYPVPNPGRVLYFDEENPEDLVFHRFIKLGLDKKSADNIRFVSNLGIRLDLDPTGVLDEALAYEPTLVVLDSLTRFHGQEENSAGAMADLFNNAFKPLARETGAGVVLIHHANKTESTSSYRRARGSGDITASVDAGFDVSKIEGGLSIKNFKSRRAAQAKTRYVSIIDTADGGVELLSVAGLSNVF